MGGILIYKNHTITLFLLIIVFVFFILYFAAVQYTFHSCLDVKETISAVLGDVKQNNWQTADQNFSRLNEFWTRAKYLIQLNNGEQSFSDVNKTFEELKTAIDSRNQYESILYLNQIQNGLDNLFKIAPHA